MAIMDNFERNVRLMLKEKGISQAELSRRLNLGKNTVNCWLKSHKEPTLSNIHKLMKELDCTFEELIEG